MKEFTLENDKIRVVFMDKGGAIKELTKKSNGTNYVICYDNDADYEDNPYFLGANIGRNAGRTIPAHYLNARGGKIDLDANEGLAHLHGGAHGMDHKLFEVLQLNKQAAKLSYYDNNPFYEDALIEITYTLNDNKFKIAYAGSALVPTIFNLTNHAYFNLDHSKDERSTILNHWLQLDTSLVQKLDDSGMPTAEFIDDQPLLFNDMKQIGEAIQANHPMIELCCGGLDFCYKFGGGDHAPKVTLYNEYKSNGLVIRSDQESSVIYTLNKIADGIPLNQGISSRKHRGITFEMQKIPNYVHINDNYLHKDYQSYIEYEIV